MSKSKPDQQLCPLWNWVTSAAFPKQESGLGRFCPNFSAPTVTDLRCSPVGIDGLTVALAGYTSAQLLLLRL